MVGVPWWLVLIEGISLIILGLLMLASPGMSTLILIQFVGIYWLVAGIFKIVSIFMDSADWGWKLVGGILGILAGLIVLQHPLWSPLVIGATLIIILGVQGLIVGVIGLVQAFRGAGWGGWFHSSPALDHRPAGPGGRRVVYHCRLSFEIAIS